MPNKIDAMVDSKLLAKANAATIRAEKVQKEMLSRTKGMFKEGNTIDSNSPLAEAMERNRNTLVSIDKNMADTAAVLKKAMGASPSTEVQKKLFKRRLTVEKEEREYRKNMLKAVNSIYQAILAKGPSGGGVPSPVPTSKPAKPQDVPVVKEQANWITTLSKLGFMGALVSGMISGNFGPMTRFALKAFKPLRGAVKFLDGIIAKGVSKIFGTKLFQNIGKSIFKTLRKGFGKIFGKIGGKLFGKLGGVLGKQIGRKAGGKVAKLGLKFLKKIPGVSMIISIPFAIGKFKQGDIVGGLLELASGFAGLFPGVGTAISVAIDAYAIFRDMKGEDYKKKEGAVLKKVGKAFLYNTPIIGTIMYFKDGIAEWKSGNKVEAMKLFGRSMLALIPGGNMLFNLMYTLVDKGKQWFASAPTAEQQAAQPKTVGQKILENLPVIGPIIQMRNAWGLWKSGDKMGALKGMARAAASIFPGGGLLFDLGAKIGEWLGKKAGQGLDTVAENPTVKKIPPAILKNLPVIGPIIRMKEAKDLWKSGDKIGALKGFGGAIASIIPGGGILFDLAATIGEKVAKFGKSMFEKLPEETQKGIGSAILRNLPVIGTVIRFKDGVDKWKSGDKLGALKEFGGAVASIIPGGGMIFDVAYAIGEKVATFGKAMFEKVPEETRQGIGSAILRNLPVIGPIIRFKDAIDAWKSGDKIGALKGLGGAVASIIPGGGLIFDTIAGFAEWLFNNPLVQGAMDIGKGLLGAAGDAFGALKDGIGSIFNGAKELASKAWEGVKNIGGGIVDGAKGLWEKGKNFFGFGDDDGGSILDKYTPEQIEAFKEKFMLGTSNLFNKAKDIAGNAIGATKDAVKGLWNKGKNFIGGLFGGEGEDAADAIPTSMDDIDLETLNVLKENIFAKARDIWQRSKDMVAGVFDKTKEVVGGLVNRGRDFLGGLFGRGGNTSSAAQDAASAIPSISTSPVTSGTTTSAGAATSSSTPASTSSRRRAASRPATATTTPAPQRRATTSPVRQATQQAAAPAADHPYTNSQLKSFVEEGIGRAKRARTIEDTIKHWNIAKWANDRLPVEMQATLPPDPSSGQVVWNNENSRVRWPQAVTEPDNGRREVGDPTTAADGGGAMAGLAALASVFTTMSQSIMPAPVPDEDSEGTAAVTPGGVVQVPGQPEMQRVRTRGIFRRRPRQTPATHNVRLNNNRMPQGLRFADNNVDISGVNANVWHNFAGMVAEYNDKTGNGVQLNSAYRDLDKQRHLYNTLPSGQAARPGRSLHNWGFALDINSADANAMASEQSDIENGKTIMERWGFYRPIQAREPWHIQPTGIDRFEFANEGQRLAQSGYTPPRMQVGDPVDAREIGDPTDNTASNMPRAAISREKGQAVQVVALSEDTIMKLLTGQAKIAGENKATLNQSGPTVNVNGRG